MDRRVTTLLGWSCALTPVVMAMAGDAIWPHLALPSGSRPWFVQAPAIIAAFAIALTLWTAPIGSRSRRVAVLLPLIHVLAAVAVWLAWRARPGGRPIWIDPLFGAVDEVGIAALGLSAAIWIAMLLPSRRRGVAPWLRWLAPFTLVVVAALGLWIPIVCSVWPHTPGSVAHWLVILAPSAIASALWMRWARSVPRQSHVPVAVALAVAIACRVTAEPGSQLDYSNLIPLVIAGCAVALAAIAALGCAHWLARRPRGGVLTGRARASEPGHAIAWIEAVGWVDGLRPVARGFTLETADGNLPVPSGGAVTTAIPEETEDLRPGERIAVIEDGDQVVVSGWERAPAEGPFRTASLPAIGSSGLAITRAGLAGGRADGVLLLLWRPCAVTVAVIAITALPAIAGLLAASR